MFTTYKEHQYVLIFMQGERVYIPTPSILLNLLFSVSCIHTAEVSVILEYMSTYFIAAARSPPKLPATAAAEKNMAALIPNSFRLYQHDR